MARKTTTPPGKILVEGVRPQESDRPTVLTKFLQAQGFTIIQSAGAERRFRIDIAEVSHSVFVTSTVALGDCLPTVSRNNKC
jgi:hypothetical protein